MRSQAESGFTLFEILVVVIIIAVLTAIAAPGWATLANRQKAKLATDQIRQALRQTQSEARRLRSDRAITFDEAAVTIDYPGDGDPGAVPLDTGSLGTTRPASNVFDFTVQNQAGNSLDNNQLIFSANGGLDVNQGAASTDLPIYLTVTPDGSGTYRCVIIRSLLGSLDTGRSAQDCQITP
ncbi:MAG: Tfp pilus assembly protein FimT/FimU [Elainellaceae cyanobacterium]